MTDDPAKKKDELLQILSEVESQAQRLEVLGQDIVRSARLSRDVVGPIRDLLFYVPVGNLSSERLDREVTGWRSWYVAAGELENTRTSVNSFVALSSAVASSSCETFTVVSAAPDLVPSVRTTVANAEARLRQVFERFPLLEQAASAMRRLGLDTPAGNRRTPLQLLSEAQGALEQPSVQAGGPASALIPLRECLDSTIAELLRRRRSQEPAPKMRDKLASLGRHCARPGLPTDHIERQATDAVRLLNDLSDAKQAVMPRQRQTELFHRGLLVLNALLESIDEALLRPT
ncbi:MAG: hypothetical protein ACRDGM_00840 [bacterium]